MGRNERKDANDPVWEGFQQYTVRTEEIYTAGKGIVCSVSGVAAAKACEERNTMQRVCVMQIERDAVCKSNNSCIKSGSCV